MNKKVDIIISYVNPNDENWIKLYNRYKKESDEEYKENRFRDTSFLKYVLRSIDKNLKWVNNVFLVVQSESQIPDWVNRETVKVVLHEEFIPSEYLPTFNCNTIEMFMHKIPNLSDYFIYFNDDMIINKPCSVNDFFNNWKCNLLSTNKKNNVGKNTWYNCLLNDTKIINKFLNNGEDENIWHMFPHTVTPLYKPLCDEAYEIFNKEINVRLTRFRDYNNFNQHFYAYFIEKSEMCSNIPLTVNYININNYKKTFFKNANAQTLCLNDSVRCDNKKMFIFHKLIERDLVKKFPKTSKFEREYETKKRNENDIDAILVYVNPNDKQWRGLYNEYIVKEKDKDVKSISDERIREMFTLKGIIRSVEKNMPFISKFHLVVQSDSQVPEWINRDEVNVVLHEDFIPKEFLPTFNSHTIEMFLHKIPNLANRYIVFNDDMLILKEHTIDDIFDGMIPKDMFYLNKTEDISYHYSLNERYYDTHPTLRLHPHINNNMFAHNYVGKEYSGETYYRPNHGFVAFNKEFVREVYNKYEEDIKRSCTKFRDDKNLYYYSYRLCNFLKYGKISLCTTNFITFKNAIVTTMEALNNNDYGCVAINDDSLENESLKELYTQNINDFIFKTFPKISKYEKDIKVGVCLLCKDEKENDLKRWVQYYKKIGFDNIIFYDNNDNDNKSQYNSIVKEIENGYIIYNNFRGKNNRQKIAAYKHCYANYSNNFDFIAFFDIDEILKIDGDKNIKDYLSDKKFEKCDIIQIGRKSVISDNNKKHVYKNELVKSIIRTNNKNIIFNGPFLKLYKYTTYSPTPSKNNIVVDSCGNIVANTPYCKNLKEAHIIHLVCRSFSDFLNKLKGGNPKENLFNHLSLSYIEESLRDFFKNFEITDKHLEMINKIFPEYDITKEIILGEIEKVSEEMEKIDYLFPFVDDNDEMWLKEYHKYKNNDTDYKSDILTGEARYKTYDLLKYKLRSIEMYMPWINNVYMIVASPSQIPEWLDTSKVKIVYHKDFIPVEFLPTFNSSTIEMFLGNIEGLSEKFIYGNDDFYVNKMTSPKMFFRGEKSLLYFYECSNSPTDALTANGIAFHKNDIELATKDIKIDTPYLYNPGHGDKPIHKSTCKLFLEKYKEEIYKSVSRFREDKNYNQYLYQLYDITHNKGITYKHPYHSCFSINAKNIQALSNILLGSDNIPYCVSIDFNRGNIDEYIINYLKNIFNKKYPNISKYEK